MSRLKVFPQALLLGLGLGLVSCKETHVAPTNISMPPHLLFALVDKTGNSLLTTTNTPIRVYALDANGQRVELGEECSGGGCTMVRPFEPPYNFLYTSLYASTGSVSGLKTWYIELGGKVDTLFYDVQKTRPNDPLMPYDLVHASFNGEILPASYPLVLQRRH